jgi:hypothetical protein
MLGDWYGKYTTSVDTCGSGGDSLKGLRKPFKR